MPFFFGQNAHDRNGNFWSDTMEFSFIGVKAFRDQIDFAFEAINCHWHACVNEQEQARWFIGAIGRFGELKQTRCKRATEFDLLQFNKVLDLFAKHCEQHCKAWNQARLVLGLISEDRFGRLNLLNQEVSKKAVLH